MLPTAMHSRPPFLHLPFMGHSCNPTPTPLQPGAQDEETLAAIDAIHLEIRNPNVTD